jgi:serine/threonine protein kinase
MGNNEEIKAFCGMLRHNISESNAFSQYLNYIRETRNWGSQDAMRSDPAVIQAYGPKSKHFPRTLDRTIKDKRTSPANLAAFSKVFELGDNAKDFVLAFNSWKREKQLLQPAQFRRPMECDSKGRFVLPKDTIVNGQSGARYIIQEQRHGGMSRALSFKARALDSRETVFIKTLALTNQMNDEDRRFRINRFTEFVERELNSLEHLRYVDGVAQIKDYGFVDFQMPGQESIRRVPFIATKFLSGEDIRTALLNRYCQNGHFRGIDDGPFWVRIATQLIEILRNVHAHGVRHGDLRPDNILISGNRVFVVDFGESGLVADPPPQKQQVAHATPGSTSTPYTAPERIRHEDLPLEEAEDIYGLGGILFWLASGLEPPRGGIENDYELKTHIHSSINTKLRDYNEGIVHVITDCLHHRPGDRTSHADDILRNIEMFEEMMGRPSSSTVKGIYHELSSLTSVAKRLPNDRLFGNMIRRDLAHTARRIADMLSAGRAEVVGTRNDMIQSLLGFVSILEPGDQYITTSSINYWMPQNLGVDGRFLCANKILALHGVCIKRVLIVTAEELKEIERGFLSDDERAPSEPTKAASISASIRNRELTMAAIVRAQVSVAKVAKGNHDDAKRTSSLPPTSLDSPDYYVGYLVVSSEQKREILQDGYHIGIIRKKNRNQIVSLSFQEVGDETVRKIYVWNVEGRAAIENRIKNIAHHLNESYDIMGLLPERERRI